MFRRGATLVLVGLSFLALPLTFFNSDAQSSVDGDVTALDQIGVVTGTDSDSARSIDVDSAGNRYVVGSINGTSTFASAVEVQANQNVDNTSQQSTAVHGSEMYLSKYSVTGALIWVAKTTSDYWVDGYAVHVDASGDIIVTGRFLGTATLSSARNASNGNLVLDRSVTATSLTAGDSWKGNGETFIARYTPTGVVEWVTTASNASQYNEANSVATDNTGNIFVTGHMWHYDNTSKAQFRSATVASTGQVVDAKTLSLPIGTYLDAFLVKYSPSGSLLWAATMGNWAEDRSFAVAVGDDGNPVVAGSYAFDIALNSARRPSDGNPTPDAGTAVSNASISSLGATDWYECFAAKYHGDGTLLWGTRLGASGTDWCEGVDVGPDNKVRVAGHFTNSFTATSARVAATGELVTANDVAVQSRGGTDVMIASYASNGSLEWVATGGATSNDGAWSATSAPNGDVVVTGRIAATPTFTSAKSATTDQLVDNTSMTETFSGGTGSVVVRYSQTGELKWLATAQSTIDVSLVDVVVDAKNRVIAAGSFSGDLTLVAGTTPFTKTSSGTDALWVRWGRIPEAEEITPIQPTTPAQPTTPTSTIAASTTTTSPTPVLNDKGRLPRIKPGNGTAVIAGVYSPVKVFIDNKNDVVVQGSGFEFRISGECEKKCSIIEVGSRQVIVFERNGGANVSGFGFRPGSLVYVWLFSEPQLLGQFTVEPDGTFSGKVDLDSVSTGEHTLQVNGISTDGASRSSSLGVVIEKPGALPATGSTSTAMAQVGVSLILAGTLTYAGAVTRRRFTR